MYCHRLCVSLHSYHALGQSGRLGPLNISQGTQITHVTIKNWYDTNVIFIKYGTIDAESPPKPLKICNSIIKS